MRIYCITNGVNGKRYVGQTTQSIERRWQQHCLLQGKCRALENAIRKYGVASFAIHELDEAQSQADLDRLERQWIERMQTISPRGYNLSGGGGGGAMHADTKSLLRGLAARPEHAARFEEMRRRPDVVAKQTQRKRERWQANKERYVAALTAAQNRPDVRRKRSVALRKAWTDPERKRQLLFHLARVRASPEAQAKKSASLRAAWGEDGVREARSTAIRAALNSPEVRVKRAMIEADPERKARQSAIASARRATPEQRAARSAAMTGKKRGPYKTSKPRPDLAAKWADPEWRSALLEKRAQVERRRRAQ